METGFKVVSIFSSTFGSLFTIKFDFVLMFVNFILTNLTNVQSHRIKYIFHNNIDTYRNSNIKKMLIIKRYLWKN